MLYQEITDFVDCHVPDSQSSSVAYSVLFGNYDRPPKLPARSGLKCFLFTDRPDLAPKPWQPVLVDSSRFGPRRTGRYFKCLGHRLFSEAHQSIYFDASFTFLKPLPNLLERYSDAQFTLFQHGERNDINAEAEACIRQGKDDRDVIDAQVERYRAEGLPSPSSCYSTGVLLRDFTDPLVIAVNEAWCAEILAWSTRDQISLPFVLWRLGLKPDVIEGDVFYNRYLVPRPHAGTRLDQQLKRTIALYLYRSRILRR